MINLKKHIEKEGPFYEFLWKSNKRRAEKQA